MVGQLEALRKLQELDGELYRLRMLQRKKPLELEEAKQHVADHQATAKAAENALKALQVKQKEAELELANREGIIKKLQTQLFQVKTNKEYAAIQQEVAQAKADVSLFEETILKLLDQIEAARQASKGEQAKTVEEQQKLAQQQTRIAQDLTEIEQRIATLDHQRTTVTPSVTKEFLGTYERILAAREGLALVPMINQRACGGCHMQLTPQTINQCLLKATLVTCQSCSRILYAEDRA